MDGNSVAKGRNKISTAPAISTNIDTVNAKSIFLKRFKADYVLYIMLLPAVVFYILFYFFPLSSIVIAFKDYSLYKGVWASDWSGMEHFVRFFTSPDFGRTLKNTLVISVSSIVFGFPAPIILALLLNEVRSKVMHKLVQTSTFIPYFISMVIACGLVTNFLAPDNGLINVIISKLGFEKTYFLTKPEWFVPIYIVLNIWKETGFNAVIYIAALTAVDSQLYESAMIDGANRFKQFLHVTLPAIMPTIIIMFIMKIGKILDVGYESIILLYQPATYETADVISSYVFREGISMGNYDFATAVGLFNSVVAFILVIIANTISNKVNEVGLW